MTHAETIRSISDFRKITGFDFCDYVKIGKVVGKAGMEDTFRTLSSSKRLENDSFHGLYTVAIKVGGDIFPVYFGKRSSDNGLRHRIVQCEFNYRQNEGSKLGSVQGPSDVWRTLKDIGFNPNYYVSYARLPWHSDKEVLSEEVSRAEANVLGKIDFIANAVNNNGRRMDDLVKIVKQVRARKAEEHKAEEHKAEEHKAEEHKAEEHKAEEHKAEEVPKTIADVFKCLEGFNEHIIRIQAIPSFSTA